MGPLGRASYSSIESKIAKEWRHYPLLPSLLKDLAVREIGSTGAVSFLLKRKLWNLVDLCTLDCNSTELTEVEDRAIEAGCFGEDVALIGPGWMEAKDFIRSMSKLAEDEESPLVIKWLFIARLLAGDGTLVHMILDLVKTFAAEKPLEAEDLKECEQFVSSCRDRVLTYALKVLNDMVMPLWYEGPFRCDLFPRSGESSLWSQVEASVHQLQRDGIVQEMLDALSALIQAGHLDGSTLKVVTVVARRLRRLAERKGWLKPTENPGANTAQDSLALSPPPPDSTARRIQQDTLMAEYAAKQANFLEQFTDEDIEESNDADMSTGQEDSFMDSTLTSETNT